MFQAWLVKIAKMAANSAPSTRPGASDMKNTIVTETKPRIGTSRTSARLLLAASVAYVKVKIRERDNARSMRSVVRAAYSGRCVGSRDSGVIRSSAIGCSRLRLASAKKIRMPRTSRTARTSQRLSARVHCWTEMGGTSRITRRSPWSHFHGHGVNAESIHPGSRRTQAVAGRRQPQLIRTQGKPCDTFSDMLRPSTEGAESYRVV